MDIKGISNSGLNVNKISARPAKVEAKEEPKDKIEISPLARELAGAGVERPGLDVIKSRIESGFYNSEAVLSKVADKLLKELLP